MMPSEEHQSESFKINVEYVYTFKHSIDRVWVILRDVAATGLLLSHHYFPVIITKGQESWSIGTEFFGKVIGFGEFFAKCVKVRNFPQWKKLVWEVYQTINTKPFYYQYHLYQVDDEQEEITVFVLKIKFYDKPSYDNFLAKKEEYEKVKGNFIVKINTILNESNLNLYQYEGAQIYSSMDKIWEFIVNLHLLKKVAPLIRLDCENPNTILSPNVGEEIKVSLDNHSSNAVLKTIKYDKRKNWNKWLICYLATSDSKEYPKQQICVTLTKVNDNECQLSWINDFKEPATSDFVKSISIQKKYIIQSVKDYLENYN